MNVESQTYQQILDALADLDAWLSGLGLPVRPDRIRLHIANISRLDKAQQDETLRALIEKKGQAKLLWSLVEATEFADAYTALRQHEPDGLRDKLRAALQGPADPSAEDPISNIGRNTMFELNLASRLLQKGVPTRLCTNPDILCEIDGARIYIQCKRPFRESTIHGNISDARRQLTRDLDNSRDLSARGIVAVSISRVLNPGKNLLVAKNEHSMRQRLGDTVQTLGDRSRRSDRRISDDRIVGILFHLITPAYIEDIALLVAAQQVVVFSMAPPGSSDSAIAGRFAAAFE